MLLQMFVTNNLLNKASSLLVENQLDTNQKKAG
jgi:hypothetical protein